MLASYAQAARQLACASMYSIAWIATSLVATAQQPMKLHEWKNPAGETIQLPPLAGCPVLAPQPPQFNHGQADIASMPRALRTEQPFQSLAAPSLHCATSNRGQPAQLPSFTSPSFTSPNYQSPNYSSSTSSQAKSTSPKSNTRYSAADFSRLNVLPIASGDLLDNGPDLADPLEALKGMGPAAGDTRIPGANHGKDNASGSVPPGVDPHAAIYAENCYPSAATCGKCHQKIYDEWRVSAHAYSTISPMFQKFEQAITQISQGTIGTFCVRCHAPVAIQMNLPRYESIVDSAPVYREGITCVACHRVREMYHRPNGERRIEPGDITQPVYGSIGGDGVARAIADKDNLKIKLDPNDKKPGQVIHHQGIRFEQLSDSSFCAACHQVAVYPGIALEVVWAQYRASPAFKKGVTCQDCHMGLVPGKAMGYGVGPAAVVNDKVVDEHRKHANHLFFGPGQSIAHPGLFPHNEKSLRWNVEQWMQFDWRAGWGTPDFEKAVTEKLIYVNFPETWKTVDERKDARKILDENMKLLDIKRQSSIAVMSAGAHIDGPFLNGPAAVGNDLAFHYIVNNLSDGHNMPSGSLGAQPQLWLNVVLTGPQGQWLWESGYLDGNGDLADQHSLQATKGMIRPDLQLFNLQTKFLITGVKGTDREMYLPINVDIDQIPFLRPGNQPISVLNHPPFIRMEAHSIPPLGSKQARYRVPGELLTMPGTYRLSVRLRSRMEPIYFMRFCNATPEMERRMLEQTLDLKPHTVEFEVR